MKVCLLKIHTKIILIGFSFEENIAILQNYVLCLKGSLSPLDLRNMSIPQKQGTIGVKIEGFEGRKNHFVCNYLIQRRGMGTNCM